MIQLAAARQMSVSSALCYKIAFDVSLSSLRVFLISFHFLHLQHQQRVFITLPETPEKCTTISQIAAFSIPVTQLSRKNKQTNKQPGKLKLNLLKPNLTARPLS